MMFEVLLFIGGLTLALYLAFSAGHAIGKDDEYRRGYADGHWDYLVRHPMAKRVRDDD